jgi:hypothetical protein
MKSDRPYAIARWSSICAAAALFLFSMPAARAADDDIAAGLAPADTQLSGQVVTDASCPYPGGCVTETGTVKVGAKTPLYGLVEINTKTCAEINRGTWASKVAPKLGTLTQGPVSGKVGSGPCKGHTYTFQELWYTGKKTGTDKFVTVWSTPDFKTHKCPTCEVGLYDTLTVK